MRLMLKPRGSVQLSPLTKMSGKNNSWFLFQLFQNQVNNGHVSPHHVQGMLYFCHLISLSPFTLTLFREERWKRSRRGHSWNTSSAERPRFCSAGANETRSTLSLPRFLHLHCCKTQAGCKRGSNAGEQLILACSLQIRHHEKLEKHFITYK